MSPNNNKMGHRHRSRSHHSRHRSRSPSKRHDSRSHRHHRHPKNSQEHDLRKKQERLAKARLLLLQEEEEQPAEVLSNKPESSKAPDNHFLHDDLDIEMGLEEVVQAGQHCDEIDSLDLYMVEIDKQAIPQDKIAHSDSEQEVQPNLDDDDYYEKFIEKFYKQEAPPKEQENKPEVLYDDEADIAWDLLIEEDESEDYLKKVTSMQQRQLQEKRLLPSTNLDLEPFRKDFYIPCPELSKLTYEETLKLREELGDIQVRGKRCPAPIINWYQCGLSDKILKLLEKKKFSGPFPVQAQVSDM